MKIKAGISIRRFVFPDDYDAVHALWMTAGPGVHLGPSDARAEIGKKAAHDPDLFLVAEQDSRIIGSVIGGFDGRRGLVYHLAVAPHLRRAGIGSDLMKALERRLSDKGCLRAYLLVTHENQEAQRFYQNSSWEPLDLLILAKDLDHP